MSKKYETNRVLVIVAILAVAAYLISCGWVFWPGFIIVCIALDNA